MTICGCPCVFVRVCVRVWPPACACARTCVVMCMYVWRARMVMYACTSEPVWSCVCIFVHACDRACVCACVRLCAYVCAYVHGYVLTCVQVRVCVCVCTSVCREASVDSHALISAPSPSPQKSRAYCAGLYMVHSGTSSAEGPCTIPSTQVYARRVVWSAPFFNTRAVSHVFL